MNITIPKCNDDHTNFPCWVPTSDSGGNRLKPIIRCRCGAYTNINLHHVHADGRVTASYYHEAKAEQDEGRKGCGWHVFLTLEAYDRGEFLPEKL